MSSFEFRNPILCLRRLLQGTRLRDQLLRSGIGSAVVKAGGVGLSFVVTLLLARVLGPGDYGTYAYVYALVCLLAIPATFGLPALVVRETAKAQASSDWVTVKGLWRWAGAVAGGLSLLLAAIGGLVAWSFAEWYSTAQLATFSWGLVLVPGLVFGRLFGACLRGLRHVVFGQLPYTILRPSLLVAFVVATMVLGSDGTLSAKWTMALHALAAGLSFLAGATLLWRVRPAGLRREEKVQYRHRAWFASALPLGFVAGTQLINNYADLLILGVFASAEQVGIYRVAVQGATLVTFGLQVVAIVVAPQFARLYAQGSTSRLQTLVTASARAALAVALPLVLVFLLYGYPLLKVLVGEDYVSGSTSLVILALGQLINAGMGLVGLLLTMTGHEGVVARSVAFAALANVAANLVLIPLWGMSGAASATTLTLIIWNSLLVWEVVKRLGINSTAFVRS